MAGLRLEWIPEIRDEVYRLRLIAFFLCDDVVVSPFAPEGLMRKCGYGAFTKEFLVAVDVGAGRVGCDTNKTPGKE